MKITILGIGMGNEKTLTNECIYALEESQMIIGAKRIIESLSDRFTKNRKAIIKAEEIAEEIKNSKETENICVAMSGDTGFYSGTKKLLPLLEGFDVNVLCGITSVQYMAAKIMRPWQNVRLVSAHGVECNILGNVLLSEECFFLTGGSITPESILKELYESGLGDAFVYVGENLSYENESITKGTAKELLNKEFDKLSVVWVIRKAFDSIHYYKGGIDDSLFVRGKVPMTKSEVRSAIVSMVQIEENDVFYDIGAGTGSIGIECAILQPMSRVFAFEVNDEACSLIETNKIKFSAYNLKLVKGKAPENFENIKPPTKAFIGGSKGNFREIVSALLEKNKSVEIVSSAVTAETFAESINVFKEFDMDIKITQITVSRTEKVGSYNMFKAQNPVFVIKAKTKEVAK